MNALLVAVTLTVGLGVIVLVPKDGASAVLLCGGLAGVAAYLTARVREDVKFLLQVLFGGLLLRVIVGAAIYTFNLQEFFGGDAFTYDTLGFMTAETWRGSEAYETILKQYNIGWGMAYMVGGIYTLIGRNMLAVQFVNAVIGAATAPVIYVCARQIFQNRRVARLAACFVAFYPSLILWSSQGLKDGPMVFALAVAILATLKLGEKVSVAYMVALAVSLLAILSLRFYVFYMMVAAIGGAFVIGTSKLTAQSLGRQIVVMIGIGLAMTYFGVLNTASSQIETYGDLQKVEIVRSDLAQSARSGFGRDVDVSTTSGALSTIPLGLIYLLFAPFPWQLASLRQSITLPEMLVWWASFPLLAAGLWYTLRFRMRRALPVLIFTTMLTLAYSVFQGNVGTAYRQRSQLLIFYFMFVSAGYVLAAERREVKRLAGQAERAHLRAAGVASVTARKANEQEWEQVAGKLSERIGF